MSSWFNTSERFSPKQSANPFAGPGTGSPSFFIDNPNADVLESMQKQQERTSGSGGNWRSPLLSDVTMNDVTPKPPKEEKTDESPISSGGTNQPQAQASTAAPGTPAVDSEPEYTEIERLNRMLSTMTDVGMRTRIIGRMNELMRSRNNRIAAAEAQARKAKLAEKNAKKEAAWAEQKKKMIENRDRRRADKANKEAANEAAMDKAIEGSRGAREDAHPRPVYGPSDQLNWLKQIKAALDAVPASPAAKETPASPADQELDRQRREAALHRLSLNRPNRPAPMTAPVPTPTAAPVTSPTAAPVTPPAPAAAPVTPTVPPAPEPPVKQGVTLGDLAASGDFAARRAISLDEQKKRQRPFKQFYDPVRGDKPNEDISGMFGPDAWKYMDIRNNSPTFGQVTREGVQYLKDNGLGPFHWLRTSTNAIADFSAPIISSVGESIQQGLNDAASADWNAWSKSFHP